MIKVVRIPRDRGLLKRKIFSLTLTTMLVLSILMIGTPFYVPNTKAGIVTHSVGNLWIDQLTDFGRILKGFTWNGQPQDIRDPMFTYGYIGLVIDQDNYDHNPGTLNIADSYYPMLPYALQDDLTVVSGGTMIIDDGTIQQSIASFQNTGVGTGDPNDILINQSAWSVFNKDWVIIQWTLLNLKGSALTNVTLGLELPLSITGANWGIGGDSGDDIDGYDATNDVYWAQDDTGVAMGFGSVMISEPITHYYSVDYHDTYTFDEYKMQFQNDTWLYDRLHSPNGVTGASPGNRSATVGWNNLTIEAGSFRTLTLAVAANNTYASMINAIKDARYYYTHNLARFKITEFSDADSGTQRVEVFNNGCEATDMDGGGFYLSVDSGATPLLGGWDKIPLPTYEYGVFTLNPGDNIGPEGDTIGLYQDIGGGNQILIDEVSYGQEGIASDPLNGESVARLFDATINDYADEWFRNASGGPTWGVQNDVAAITSSPRVVLNRVMFNPYDSVEAYIEMRYIGGSSMDISGYKIICDNEFEVPQGTVLDTVSRHFVLNQSIAPTLFADLGASGDNIYLYDSNGYLRDMVGWSSLHTQGYFMSRVPEGGGTYRGFDDVTSLTAGWAFDNVPGLLLTEFYVDGTSGVIELYNPRGGDKALGGHWSLSGDSGPLTGTYFPDPLPSGGYTVFSILAGNPGIEGDVLTLYYDGIERDQISFGIKGAVPDPPFGNSTERYWDDATMGYSDNWTISIPWGPTWGAPNNVLPDAPTQSIILNEVMFNPTAPDGGYVVIINKELWTINARDYYIVCDNVYQLSGFGDILLEPFERYIIGYNPTDPALTAFFQNMTPGGDNAYLFDVGGQFLDMVGWNSPHTTGMSVRRIPDGSGTFQGYNDSTSEAAGWVFDCSLQVLITELSDNESTMAQIEVYNPWYPPIHFDSGGFSFATSSYGPLSGVWSIPTASTNSYALFDVTSINGLDYEGDTVSLYQNSVLIEEISYGLKGTVPDPLPGESVERYWDGYIYTNVWERNWTSGPNFGFPNDIPPANFTSTLILNEVFFTPSIPGNAYIEIFNKNGFAINPTGYKIVANTEYTITSGEILGKANPFVYFINPMDPSFFQNIGVSGDNIYLYDANGSLVDMVGWDSPHSINSSMSRLPDGNGSRDGYDDVSSTAAGWRFDQVPSIHLIQIFPDGKRDGSWGEEIIYDLGIRNKHSNNDVIDIRNVSEPWGWDIATCDLFGVPLTDSNGNGLPDVFVLAGGQADITVRVKVPTQAVIGIKENTTITITSNINTLYKDNATLVTTVVLPPPSFKTVTFPVGSFVIPMDWRQTDVLKAFGFVHALLRNGSVIYRIIEPPNISIFTTLFSGIFEGGPVLIMPKDASIVNSVKLSFPSVTLDTTIVPFTSTKVDIIYRPTNILIIRGQWGHTEDLLSDMEIPFTIVDPVDVTNDPNMLFDYDLIVDDCPGWGGNIPSDVASNMQQIANSGGEIIFTDIALLDMDAVFPGRIPITPNTGGTFPCSVYNIPEFPGQYYGPSTLDLYTMGGGQIMDAPTDPNVRIMVDSDSYGGQYRVLAAYFYCGTRIDELGIVEGFGYHPGDQPPQARVLASIFFGNKFVHLPPPSNVIEVQPPIPYIRAQEDNITLNWTHPSTIGISHYLIYRATSQTDFDFSDVWVNTSQHDDNGIISLRTTLNDTGAASVLAPSQYYYIMRAVSNSGEISSTSRTVGKWTTIFGPGVSTFSLPLELLDSTDVDSITTDMGADYIKYLDTSTHTWVQHNLGDGNTNNVAMRLGEGYEVKFSVQTIYTFTGMPGAMITYDNDTGFAGFNYASDAKSLSVSVQPNGDVDLTWQEPTGMGLGDWYEIYYSYIRDGFFGMLDVDYFPAGPSLIFGSDIYTHPGALANDPGTRLYYIVVPFNSNGIRGSSTYSIGIWTEEILSQYDSFGIPLKMSATFTADWYCDSIPDAVGINYFMFSQQRWGWHSTQMAAGAFDPTLVMTEGYQISTSNPTKYTFIGI